MNFLHAHPMPWSEESDLTVHHYAEVVFFSNDNQFPSAAGDTLSPTFYKAIIILQAIYRVQRVMSLDVTFTSIRQNQKT